MIFEAYCTIPTQSAYADSPARLPGHFINIEVTIKIEFSMNKDNHSSIIKYHIIKRE